MPGERSMGGTFKKRKLRAPAAEKTVGASPANARIAGICREELFLDLLSEGLHN
ncbi:MAG: hypothetical protein Q9196_002949 [Gyalolechia fulgens]